MQMNFIHSKVFIVEMTLTHGTAIITMTVLPVTSTDKVNHCRHPMDQWYLSWSRTTKGLVFNIVRSLKLDRILTGSRLEWPEKSDLYDMFISHYRTDSHLMVHAQPLFCRGANDTMNYGDALDHATANGVDLQFLEDNEIFRACEDSEHGIPNLFEVEIYR